MNNNNINNINNFINMGNSNNNVKTIIATGGNQTQPKEKEPKEILPRKKDTIKTDFYKNEIEKLNIVMATSNGFTIIMPTPPYISIKQLIRNYISKLGLGENVLNGSLIFLFNAAVIDVNDETPVCFLFKNNTAITIVDVKNVIAA